MKNSKGRHLPAFMLSAAILTGMASCKKTDNNGTPPVVVTPTDTATTLKSASSVPIGLAIGYSLFKNNAAYKNVVVREADQVTFDYNMKHGAIVKDDGSFDYSGSDEMTNLATASGLGVLGHTLVWHENQNGTYLRSLTTSSSTIGTVNLLSNGDLEAGTGTSGPGTTLFTGWNLLLGGSAAGTFSAVAGNGSTRALDVAITTAGANAFDVQAIGTAWTAVSGTQYRVSVDIKTSTAGGKVRLVNQNTQYQQSEITPTTSWATYTWTLSALETSPILRLNFPVAGIYTIDNIKINEVITTSNLPPAQIATAVDTAMSRFIRNTVTRYAGKVKAWDVVNEAMSDGTGAVRNNTGVTTGDRFYWSQYLGRDFALKAFQYAKAADPSALLFINDYNLESDSKKLDSLIAYVAELRAKGARIDGIGTQMHMSINTPQNAVDNMFSKLAATGLKVRVSELDIRVNPANTANFTATPALLDNQAAMYKYVVDSYFRNVPAGQRYDFTIWGVADT
ncbi:MAG TPA: endo-1,4-beta-xylanase, partial [Flavisolibacter sp.]|nr:endo-1,4-beta-xylanase [Flavisolibacter sp.]